MFGDRREFMLTTEIRMLCPGLGAHTSLSFDALQLKLLILLIGCSTLAHGNSVSASTHYSWLQLCLNQCTHSFALSAAQDGFQDGRMLLELQRYSQAKQALRRSAKIGEQERCNFNASSRHISEPRRFRIIANCKLCASVALCRIF